MKLYFSDKLICQISEKQLTVLTRNGDDFLQGGDGMGRATWNLYFSENNGIVAKEDGMNPKAPQFKVVATIVEGVSDQYLTEVIIMKTISQ